MTEWLAYCHMCMREHAEWAQGAAWQCQRCLFRIPAAHLWWWCPIDETRTIVQEAALSQMEMF
jgi:hypothetical protein